MGLRMYCWSKLGKPNKLESPKLYGYYGEEELPSHKCLHFYLPTNELEYHNICVCSYLGPYELTEDQFTEFIGLYLRDLTKLRKDDGIDTMLKNFCEDCVGLAEMHGPKLIEFCG
jgi:hypothetical protein